MIYALRCIAAAVSLLWTSTAYSAVVGSQQAYYSAEPVKVSSWPASVTGRINVVTSGGVVVDSFGGAVAGPTTVTPGTGTWTTVPSTGSVGVVSSSNSTTATLSGGGVWTGATEDMLGFSGYATILFSDVDSAANGVSFQFSPNGTNWDHLVTKTLTGGTALVQSGPRDARYFRIVYTNGAGAQSAFRVGTILNRSAAQADIITLGDTPVAGQNAAMTHALITGLTTAGGGSYVNVKVSPSGAVQVGGAVNIDSQIGGALRVTSTGTVVSTGSISAFQGGTWNVGTVTTIPSIPAGTNNIGSVNLASQVGGALGTTSTNTVVSTGSITAFQGGTWNINSITTLPSLAAGSNVIGRVNGSTIAVQCLNAAGTAFESCAGGSSGSGATTVTPGTGTWSVSLSSNGSFTAPFYTISTNSVVSTGSITSFQGGSWAANVNGSTVAVVPPGGGLGATIFHNVRLTDGSGFYTAGAGSGVQSVFVSSGFVNIVSTFSAGNPGFVNLGAQTGGAIGVTSTGTVVSTGSITAFQGGAWSVNGSTVGVGSVFPGTGGANLGKAEDATHNSADVGVAALFVRRDAPAVETSADGEYSMGVVDSAGYVLTSSRSVLTIQNGASLPRNVGYGTDASSVPVKLQGVNLTGTSVDVNCTGGCGSPTQAVSFVAIATATIIQGATHFTLMNHVGSTVTIKVQRVDVAMYADAAVTGVVAGYNMYLISAATAPTTAMLNSAFFKIDTNDTGIAPGVTLSTGGSATNPTLLNPQIAFGSAAMTSEETTLVAPAIIYDYRNLGDKPLILRPGQGFTIKQAPAPAAAAGKVIFRAFITQQ